MSFQTVFNVHLSESLGIICGLRQSKNQQLLCKYLLAKNYQSLNSGIKQLLIFYLL